MRKKRTYHFDVGNSTDGPVGFCAAIRATSTRQAMKRLRERLPTEVWILAEDAAEYIRVYINPKALATKDVDWTAQLM